MSNFPKKKGQAPLEIGLLTGQACFVLFILLVSGILFLRAAYAGTLSCSVTTAGACAGTVMYRMSGATNAHAELPSQATAAYDDNVVCCTGVTGLGTSCTGTFDTALKLSGTTNAHSEQNTEANYANNACISVSSGNTVLLGYQATNCTGFDTTLGSMSDTTNAHVGDGAAYTTKICGTATGGAPAYVTSGYLIASTFDTARENGVAYNTLLWKGSKPANTNVKIQLATSNCSNGATNAPTCNSGAWGATGSNYLGSDCTNASFYTPDANTAIEIKCYASHNNKRYFKYKIILETTDTAITSQVDDVAVNYSQ